MIAASAISAANYSEVLQKTLRAGRDAERLGRLLLSLGLIVEPVTVEDAESAARLWLATPQLSLGDRLCLALAQRLGVAAWTADRGWAAVGGVTLIR